MAVAPIDSRVSRREDQDAQAWGEGGRSVIDIRIEPADEKDVLDCVASPADQRFFLDRIRRGPGAGHAFLAFQGSVAVGHVYLRLEAAEEEQIRDLLPGVPLLERLRVFDPHRNQSVGRQLVAAVEDAARRANRRQLALGVDVREPHPIDFYLKLDYKEWEHGLVKTSTEEKIDGRWERKPEFCRIFVKELRTP